MTIQHQSSAHDDAIRLIPLGKLKKSPRNARRTAHPAEAIEALAASIAVKGLIQPPVVEPERDPTGQETGAYFVTVGEGRRQALLLRVKRKEITKAELVRCIVDETNDAHEISLDENVTRTSMHPADQFEAFRRLADERGYGAEDIAARFGVSAATVRQRLRLAGVSPRLIAAYRDDALTLEQLMAFAVSEDPARQEAVYDSLGWNRSASHIRRCLTETHVPASDRRARFLGADVYLEAGGEIVRDLFSDDEGGWFVDPILLERLVLERLQAKAEQVQRDEGWLWAEASVDFPYDHGLRRIYPEPVERPEDQQRQIDALEAEYESLLAPWQSLEDIPEETAERLKSIDAALGLFGEPYVYPETDRERAGLFVALDHQGEVRVERGFLRPVDEVAQEDEPTPEGEPGEKARVEPEEAVDDAQPAPLSDKLVTDLTAHRTAALRDSLAEHPAVALLAVIHALVLRLFFAGEALATCLDLRAYSEPLSHQAPGIEEGRAGQRIRARHEAWAKRLPRRASEVWTWLLRLDGQERAALLAHCGALTVNAVQGWERRPDALAHADELARSVNLDMTAYWRADAAAYLGRVTKARILVREFVAEGAAQALIINHRQQRQRHLV